MDDARDCGAFVRVRGAREHNLKNVDVDIPRDALVVFSGVSGSGKSSLAFGTLYAEAQRRYLESLSPYARRLIEQAGVPEVDAIDGLPPAVALQQQRGTPNARSSVGSLTAMSSLVRMLYSRAGDYPAAQPMLYAEDFSPNTPQGACPTCHGLGRIYDVTEAAMVPDPSLSIRERAVAAWPPAWHGQNLRDILVSLGYDVDRPWRELPRKDRDWILYTEETPTVPVYAGFTPRETRAAVRSGMAPSYMGTFTGVRQYVLQTFAGTQSATVRRRVGRFLTAADCPACQGRRLKPEALSVRFAGLDIAAFSALPLDALAERLAPVAAGAPPAATGPRSTLGRAAAREAVQRRVAAGGSAHAAAPDVRRTPAHSQEKRIAAQRMAQGLLRRIATLQSLGLGYLSLDRATPTLSPGELQRLRLATQLASQLFGVVYVLDEPSAGLHPDDSEALYAALQALKAAGNSVFVVEHDLAVMRRADWLVDVGPDAGEQGGRVLYSGPPAGLAEVAASRTRSHLFETLVPRRREPVQPQEWLRLAGVTRNNLRQLDVALPLACMTVVTGVSGCGKSSLVSQALVDLVRDALGGAPADEAAEGPSLEDAPVAATEGRLASGLGRLRRLVQVDQKPIGRTPRSNLATYTGLFDAVRKLFAATPAARRRHYDAGRFSFNLPKGRCATCEGEGFVAVELLFMPSVYAPCPDCQGARYNPQTLEVEWQGRNIAQVLRMTVDEAARFFAAEDAVARPLQVLQQIGLGYLRLGQPATELSGGEAQRIKLATELQRAQRGDALYVLDEPSTGLHACDVDRLMLQLDALVRAGNTVVMVEHEMRIAAQADWVIDMGPGAGAAGGRIVAQGPPQAVARERASRTAPHLAACLEGAAGPGVPTPR
ncbi:MULTISPECIES: excinuclease ABC subunit UvrA [Ramlibacter]|uniref:UvrABC system protein A n=1 Tax=Ramlibacter aquaticus TaxID=2780094 RepID=A0ABR9SED8_9BURK|nr:MULTISPECIES: excinuclease ABC subunit UvrA [Ramlibacter]MBE7940574.1 excinuclease ABC subunit UvrA [Ramlibacter aquaticus]